MICFFDTHLLVCTMDASDPLRQEKSIARLARSVKDDTIALSTQVLTEFYSITTRQLRPPVSPREAAQQVARLGQFQVVGASTASILAATELAQQHRLSWWDALMLEAALRANADVWVTGAGEHGRRFGKLVLENPFSLNATAPRI